MNENQLETDLYLQFDCYEDETSEYYMESNPDAKPSKGMYILASLGNKENHTKVKMLIDSGASMSSKQEYVQKPQY